MKLTDELYGVMEKLDTFRTWILWYLEIPQEVFTSDSSSMSGQVFSLVFIVSASEGKEQKMCFQKYFDILSVCEAAPHSRKG